MQRDQMETQWDEVVRLCNCGVPPNVLLAFMESNSLFKVPQYGPSVRLHKAEYKECLEKLLAMPSAQQWLRESVKVAVFAERCWHYVTRYNLVKYEESSFVKHFEKAMNQYVSADEYTPEIIHNVIMYSTVNNDIPNDGAHAKMFRFLCDVTQKFIEFAREEVSLYILQKRHSAIPTVVSVGIITPIVNHYYATRPPRTLPVDGFLLKLLALARYYYTNAKRVQETEWFSNGTKFLRNRLTASAHCNSALELVQSIDTEYKRACELLLWSTLKELVEQSGFLPSSPSISIPIYWATNAPIELVVEKSCAPEEAFTILSLALRSITEPGTLTICEWESIDSEVREKLRQRVPIDLVAPTVRPTVEDLREKERKLTMCYHRFHAFRQTLSDSPLLRYMNLITVAAPILEGTVILEGARVTSHRIFQEMMVNESDHTIDEILKSGAESLDFQNIIMGLLSPTSEQGFCTTLQCTLQQLQETVDTINFNDLEIKSQTWCDIRKVPRLLDFLAARDSVKKLVALVGQSMRHVSLPDHVNQQKGSLDEALPLGTAIVIPNDLVMRDDSLYELLKSTTSYSNGKQYRDFEKKLSQKYSRELPQGVKKEIIDNLLNYCQADVKPLRDFRELDVRGLRSKLVEVADGSGFMAWNDAESKKLLAASNTLVQTMPLRLRKNDPRLRNRACGDVYDFNDLCKGVSEVYERHREMFEDLKLDQVSRLLELARMPRSGETSVDEAKALIMFNYGVFECRTTEEYDAPDGIARSYKISIKRADDAAREERLFGAETISVMLAGAGVSAHTRGPALDHFATVVPVLRRFVEIGIFCLKAGYREFVDRIQRDFPTISSLLSVKSLNVNGRATGFQFTARLNAVVHDVPGQHHSAHLSEMVRCVASECEHFVSSVQQLRASYPVMYCFNLQEIGHVISVMLQENLTTETVESVRITVKLRLGDVSFDMESLYGHHRSTLDERLLCFAQVLAGLCAVVPSTAPTIRPCVVQIKNPSMWPLAVANILHENRCEPRAFQLCLPMGTPEELYSAREAFLRRVRSGVVPLDDRDCIFILVVPELALGRSSTCVLLQDECRDMRLRLFVVVAGVAGLNTRGALPLDADFVDGKTEAVRNSQTGEPAFAAFASTTTQMFAVIGPTRSGKVKIAQDHSIVGCVPCERFLHGTTRPHNLQSMLLEIEHKRDAALIEVGTTDNSAIDQLQSLVFSLLLRIWPSRDGTAAQRKNPAILKVHTTLANDLPVLLLLKAYTATETRPSATLSQQFRQYMTSHYQSSKELFGERIDAVGQKLACPSTQPLSATDWSRAERSVEMMRSLESSNLPEYLMVLLKGLPRYFYINEQLVSTEMQRDAASKADWQCVANMTSDELRTLAFEIFDTPQEHRARTDGQVMTPSIFMSLVRLDLSVRCRQLSTMNREDDGVVTFVGDTGSGKSQLVDTFCRYRGWGPARIIHVTCGTSDLDIISEVHKLWVEFSTLRADTRRPTVIFFDEFNTSPAQDVIKRIMLDRRLPTEEYKLGHRLPSTKEGWIFIAACNPYIVMDRSNSPRGHAPILKYTVQSHVSPSLVDSCWRLPLPTPTEESLIINTMCSKCKVNVNDANYFVCVIPVVHKFLQEHAPMVPCSFRTVSRLLRLYRYLDKLMIAVLDEHGTADATSTRTLPSALKSHLAPLALAANYIVSLPLAKRSLLMERMQAVEGLQNSESISTVLEQFGAKVYSFYSSRIRSISKALPGKLHRIQSLNETLAITFLCVYTQTPLILLGPPGSSKTLATFMVAWSDMQCSPYLRRLEEPLYFQCSSRTTAFSIETTMSRVKVQQADDHSVLVQVFDEIGNADQAYGHPLRVLNQYLERNLFDDDGRPESVDLKSVAKYSAFIATSNYYIDMSLLGRAIVLQRDNPNVEELQQMFPPGANPSFVKEIGDMLIPVESMQGQHSRLIAHSDGHCRLTMRDIYAFLAERRFSKRCLRAECPCDALAGLNAYCCDTCQTGTPCASQTHVATQENEPAVNRLKHPKPKDDNIVRLAIVKAMGDRGERFLNLNVDDHTTVKRNIQKHLLRQRLLEIQRTSHDVRTLQRDDSDATEATFFQLRQRPLLIEADHLSTIFAALEEFNLLSKTEVIYGKFLVNDDQMVSSTMMQLRRAMVTPDIVCLMVDCDPLFDSLLDVFNGFFRRDGSNLWTVRVVLDGRSNYWPVSENFSSRIVLARVRNGTPLHSFTPAMESRFEKLFISNELFTRNVEIDRFVKFVEELHIRLRVSSPNSGVDGNPSIIYGYHPLMLAENGGLLNDREALADAIQLVASPALFARYTQLTDPREALRVVKKLVNDQNLDSILERTLSQNASHSLVLCPLRDTAGEVLSGDLHSSPSANSLLEHVAEALARRGVGARTLLLRSGTLDMLFEVAIRNTLSTVKSTEEPHRSNRDIARGRGGTTPGSVAVIAISHSSTNPLMSSHISAVCHFVASCAEEYRVRVLMFVPCEVSSFSAFTIPRCWGTSYCEQLNPLLVSGTALEEQCHARGYFRLLPVGTLTTIDAFGEARKQFVSDVVNDLSEVCFSYVKGRMRNGASACAAVAEANEYQRIISLYRWNLSLHVSNHRYFSKHKETIGGWSRLSSCITTPVGSFLLSPTRDGGLPTAQSITQRCAPESLCNAVRFISESLYSPHARAATAVSDANDHDIVALQQAVTMARLSGAQSHNEIIQLVRHRHFVSLPLQYLQLWILRHYISFSRQRGPSTQSSPYSDRLQELSGEDMLQLLIAADNVSASVIRDNHQQPIKAQEIRNQLELCCALTSVAPSSHLNRIRNIDHNHILGQQTPASPHDPLAIDASDALSIGGIPPDCQAHLAPRCDVFVRFVLLFGRSDAKQIFDDELRFQRGESQEGNDEVQHILATFDGGDQPTRNSRLMHAVKRYFIRSDNALCADNETNSTLDTQRYGFLIDRIREIRNGVFHAEQRRGLQYVGHYVRLVRAFKEQLLIPLTSIPSNPETPNRQAKPRESLIGAISYEMAKKLTVEGLPAALKEYVQSIMGNDAAGTKNAVHVLVLLTQRTNALIAINNRYLTECDDLLAQALALGVTIPPRSARHINRPCITWPFLTVHHRIISTELLDEVIVTHDCATFQSARDLCYHLEEAIVGLPIIDANEYSLAFATDDAAFELFAREPTPQMMFLPQDHN
ncbi:Hypothetical protein, putative [Bodo saltans]|uniref:AAA+ ATPase domain-containing protein n=1 Tax=Bodo saltans TaxID=75058 RepID=A0A0S4KHQ9_BODSA|nr:Hypothetical protein, putative [Bodo saltans]|eukprot:CUI11136.1 Hypothetical protein, putative [Bodo saltans]